VNLARDRGLECDPLRQRREHDLPLQKGKLVPDAHARPSAKRDVRRPHHVLLRLRPESIGIEALRIGEELGAAMHAVNIDEDPDAGGEQMRTDPDVAHRPATDDVCGGIEPHRLFEDLDRIR
jgi:hypothetical protein